MLVLTRKQGQTIVIDDRIKITLVKVKRGTVRVGIEAPDEVPIRRGELGSLRAVAENHAA